MSRKRQGGPPQLPIMAGGDPLGMRSQMVDYLEWMRVRQYTEAVPGEQLHTDRQRNAITANLIHSCDASPSPACTRRAIDWEA